MISNTKREMQMGRVAQGGWVETAQMMDRIRSAARDAGNLDPIEAVVAEHRVTRQAARRLLAAYDVVSGDVGRLRVTASLGSIEAWRLLSEADPAWAARIRDSVLTGGLPLSAVKDALDTARVAGAVPAAVAAMSTDDIIHAVREAVGCPLTFQEPKGLAEDIPADFDHWMVTHATAEAPLEWEPLWALLISPALPLSRSHGASSAAFRKSIREAVSIYPLVVVACASPIERSALVAALAECRWRPGVPAYVTLGDWSRPGLSPGTSTTSR